MQDRFIFKKKHFVQLILSAAFITAAQGSFGQDVVDLGTVQSTAADSSVQDKESAAYQAPTQASLEATQPQSILNQHYIEENAAAGANYADIVSVAPSIVSINPNGPGMMETQYLTMRGFHDGQYNVTFDGIPWGDSNDFTHHSTSYFMSQDIGNIVVDRGPGGANTFGYATAGGTIAVNSKDPQMEPTTKLYGETGSFNSHLVGAQFDTGVMKNNGDTSAFIDYKNFTTDGFLTNTNQARENIMVKFAKPISDDTVLTFVAMENKLTQNVSYGTSAANIAKYGYNYALSNDPTRQDYTGYNLDNITADFEYVGLKTQLGDWKIDNKLYTYAYYHNGFNGGAGSATGAYGDPSTNGTTYGANNVPGEQMNMDYRSYGDQLHMTEALGKGMLDTGVWVDHQTNNRALWEVDYTLGGAINPAGAPSTNGWDRVMTDSFTTIQPYVQYAWKTTDALTLTTGVKYSSFSRSIDATVNQGSGGPYSASQSWSKFLPSIDAHYAIEPNWTAYVQYAEGFLAPRLNTFYAGNSAPGSAVVVNSGTANAMTSQNFQVGSTWVSGGLTLSGDVYQINFDNENKANSAINGITYFTNTGAIQYTGIESEATYVVGGGFSVYGNFSINNNTSTAANLVLDSAKNTSAEGLIYNQGAIYASLIDKQVGQRFGDVTDPATGNNVLLPSYSIADLNVSYTLKGLGSWGKKAKIGFQVNNLFNASGYLATGANTDPAGNPLYYVIPERNYAVNFSISM